MIFFDGTEPKNKNKVFFAESENKTGIVFIDCNLKVIASGFTELIDSIIGYARKHNILNRDLLENVICVFKRIIDLIRFTKKEWESMNKISIGVICTFTHGNDNRIIYAIIAPHFFPVERIEQII